MTDAHVHPEIVAWIAGAAFLYAVGVRRVGRDRARSWPAHRSAAFAAGLLVALAALESPLAWRAEDLLSAHMVQHLLLMLVAAPLIVLGAPLSLALRATRGRAHGRLAAAVRSRPARVLTHPLLTWTAFAAATVGTHLTGFYDLAVREAAVHLLEHALYIVTALLFWLPVLGTNPVRQVHSWLGRTLYLLLSMPPMSAVSVLLIYATAPRYPTYAESARVQGVSALADQQEAGAYMWVFGSLVIVGMTVAIGWQALMREERRQRALEALEGGT